MLSAFYVKLLKQLIIARVKNQSIINFFKYNPFEKEKAK
jgi:hypothetical protein